jgi:hypothetical protein
MADTKKMRFSTPLHGREADRNKLKNGLKKPKMHFLPVFELMLDSLMAI